MTRRGWVLFLTMGLIWGIPYLLIKVAVGGLNPATLVFLRTAIAALILIPIAAGRGDFRGLLRHWRPLLAFAVVEVAVPWLLLNSAETRLSSSLSGLLIAGVPLVGALLAWATGGERLGPQRILGLLVGIAGVGALVGLDLHVGDVWALLAIAGVAVGYAVGPWILARYLAGSPGLGVISFAMAVTALGYLPFALTHLPAHVPGRSVLASVLVLGLVCTALAFVVFFALIAEVGPVRATVITYINPAVAVTLGVLLLHERFTVGVAVGFALVLTGSVLATRRSRPSASTEPEPVTAPS